MPLTSHRRDADPRLATICEEATERALDRRSPGVVIDPAPEIGHKQVLAAVDAALASLEIARVLAAVDAAARVLRETAIAAGNKRAIGASVHRPCSSQRRGVERRATLPHGRHRRAHCRRRRSRRSTGTSQSRGDPPDDDPDLEPNPPARLATTARTSGGGVCPPS